MKISERLSSIRKARGLSQRALASISGISHTTIARIETDVVVPDTATIEKLASALNVTVHYLAGWTDGRTDYDDPDFIAKLEVPPDFEGAKEEYADYLFNKDLYTDIQIEAAEAAEDDEDIRFIARKMKKADPEHKEMLMRMIRAAFADDDDND